MSKLERASFSSKLGVILATAGSAVGLGNIWRFPYMTGQNGGAVFIMIYVICVLLLGIPCMISEFIIGRHGQANTARSFRKLSGGTPWRYSLDVHRLYGCANRIPDFQLLRCSFRLVSGIYVGFIIR